MTDLKAIRELVDRVIARDSASDFARDAYPESYHLACAARTLLDLIEKPDEKAVERAARGMYERTDHADKEWGTPFEKLRERYVDGHPQANRAYWLGMALAALRAAYTEENRG